MTRVFYGHYENQFVVAQSELTYISFSLANSSLSSLRAPLKIVHALDGEAILPAFALIDVKLTFRRVPAVVSTIKRKKMTELTKDTKHNRQDESTRPSLHRCKFTDRYLRFSRRFPLLGISRFLIALNNRKKHTIKP